MDPISIRIPPELKHLIVSPSTYRETHPECEGLVVGALIFQQLPGSEPAMLLIQRASAERAFPNEWEMPGGSAEDSDPTVLHSVAREVFEETGLHLTRVIRQIGEGVAFTTRQKCVKLSFEIEVLEIGQSSIEKTGAGECSKSLLQTADTAENSTKEKEHVVPVTLNPVEHQRHAWLTEADLKSSNQGIERMTFVGDDTLPTILAAFDLHRTAEHTLAEPFSGFKPTSMND